MYIRRFVVVFVVFVYGSSLALGFDAHYDRTGEIPEPLLFDLVRRVNSQRGELEVNTLLTQKSAEELSAVYLAPEIEYAFADGQALEVELPTVDGKIKTFKTALQFQLPNWWGDVTGTQLMHEQANGVSERETTLLLLSGKRLSERWSIFSMIGNRFVAGAAPAVRARRGRELPIVNVNVFYDYAEAFDLGFETNLRGLGASFEELVLMPQIHALMAKDFKLQAGFGAAYDGYRFAPVSAFRLIKEFNH